MTEQIHLFAFDADAPRGGFGDYQGTFESVEAARAIAWSIDLDTYHIVAVRGDTIVLIESNDLLTEG